MPEEIFNTRNEAIEFARRTKVNLEFIEQAKSKGEPVHEVTQLTLSLLGLIVFPKEQLLLDAIDEKPLRDLTTEGWPEWQITLDSGEKKTKSLGTLVWHLRNAISHRGLKFISDADAEHLNGVAIRVEDKPSKNAPTNWRAEISGTDLRDFCIRFANLVDGLVG